ncbi:MAG: hypothetical protein JO166_05845 [Deltaproteobacteria bacterium]|nr:hypothetical protein [Deltaproteobacteria bacterium]
MNTNKVTRSIASHLTITGAVVVTALCLLTTPAQARWGGAGWSGGGFHYGGDGFGGGDPSYSSRSQEYQSYHSTNQSARFNEANSMNQTRYNQAQSMQNQHYQNESALSHQQYDQASNLQSNSHYDPYGGCCGSSGSSEAGAAAVGMMGGMAMGSMIRRQQQPTTVVNEYGAPPPSYVAPPPYSPYGAPAGYPQPRAYRPFFNGSQVVYGPPM